MLDIGVSKLLIIGGLALIVVGPERLPRVARTLGTLMGRAQRYISDVKAEVNRSMELEELRQMQAQFQTTAQDLHSQVHDTMQAAQQSVNEALHTGLTPPGQDASPPAPVYRAKKLKWRQRQAALPVWYKQRARVRSKALSGAARVARYRPVKFTGKP